MSYFIGKTIQYLACRDCFVIYERMAAGIDLL